MGCEPETKRKRSHLRTAPGGVKTSPQLLNQNLVLYISFYYYYFVLSTQTFETKMFLEQRIYRAVQMQAKRQNKLPKPLPA